MGGLPACNMLLRVAATVALALAATVALAQQCTDVPAGAIAWYPGERHADDAVGPHNGQLVNGAGYGAGFVGEGFVFDGVDDAIFTDSTTVERRAVHEAFSYELWARPTGVLGTCPEGSGSNCSGNGLRWAIFPAHGETEAPAGEAGLAAGIGIAIGNDGVCVGEHSSFLVDCLARVEVPIADWAHIVAVIENKTPRIYINGVLARTGVPSAKEFVFASWEVIGSGLSLGRFQGELDEVTIYDRALSDEKIAELFLAGTNGKCLPACGELDNDVWQNADILATSGLRSSSADGLFGAQNVSPEVDSLLFADGLPDGTVHSIEWESQTPVSLVGFNIAAIHEPIGNTQRAFRHLLLQAREIGGIYQTIYTSPIVVPYGPNSRTLQHCVNLRLRLAQQFRAEFTQDGLAGFSGPRVMELDGIGLPDGIFADGFEAQ